METEDREYSDYETEEESPRTPRPRRTLGYAVHRFTVRTKDAAGAVRDAFEATGDRYKKAWDRVDKWADGNKVRLANRGSNRSLLESRGVDVAVVRNLVAPRSLSQTIPLSFLL